jgi:hypothetical protein
VKRMKRPKCPSKCTSKRAGHAFKPAFSDPHV